MSRPSIARRMPSSSPETGRKCRQPNAKNAAGEKHMENLFVALFEILSFGAIVVLVVLGLGIIASMMGIFNFAQGEFVLLGAYVTYIVHSAGAPVWVGMVAAPFAVGGLGFVLGRTL